MHARQLIARAVKYDFTLIILSLMMSCRIVYFALRVLRFKRT